MHAGAGGRFRYDLKLTKVGRRRGWLLAGVSGAALALICWLPTTVSAADFTAGNDQQLRDAIVAANASPDASSTIRLTGSFAVSGTGITVLTHPITIDTQGFTLTGIDGTGATALNFQPPGVGGNTVTFIGTLIGADSATGTGQVGLGSSRVGLINYGSIIGGGGDVSGAPGVRFNNPNAPIINNGLIQGGNGTTNGGGAGIDLAGTMVPATLTNNGTIRGGTGPAVGGAGVLARIGVSQIANSSTGVIEGGAGGVGITTSGATVGINLVNRGTVRGGAGAFAISTNGTGGNLDIINSGTIRAGAGQATAIQISPSSTSAIHLELQDGSQIFGNVIANPAAVGDSLRLSGTASNSLDLSQYQNFDSFEKVGTGTWSLTGTSSFTGPTSIAGGTLSVNGSLAGSAVTVQSGATLAGSGTVGATTLLGGSRIAPGNSIGTLTVNGAFAQSAGSSYQVEVDPGTVTSDLIKVNGTATLATGAGLSVVNYTGSPYVLGQRYTILTSTGLTGTYGFPEQVLTPFLSLRDSYDARNAYLTVVQTQTAGSIGTSPNEVEVGKSIDSLPGGDPVQSGVYNQASIDAAGRALNDLSGEIHASAKTALIEDSWLLRTAINDRLRSAFGSVGSVTLNYGYSADLAPSVKGPMPLPQTDRFAVWGQGYGSWGRTDSDGNAARLKRSTGGFLVGADAAVYDNLRFGVVAGYSRSDFDVNSRLSSGESDNYHLGLYGGGQWGA
uniref:autotransporter outer membrane beta-barrel domain-containing protein n=1 Tax=Bosea sp. UNC402CLCol TaxID=1510531 RepID=UPI0012E0A919